MCIKLVIISSWHRSNSVLMNGLINGERVVGIGNIHRGFSFLLPDFLVSAECSAFAFSHFMS